MLGRIFKKKDPVEEIFGNLVDIVSRNSIKDIQGNIRFFTNNRMNLTSGISKVLFNNESNYNYPSQEAALRSNRKSERAWGKEIVYEITNFNSANNEINNSDGIIKKLGKKAEDAEDISFDRNTAKLDFENLSKALDNTSLDKKEKKQLERLKKNKERILNNERNAYLAACKSIKSLGVNGKENISGIRNSFDSYFGSLSQALYAAVSVLEDVNNEQKRLCCFNKF